LNTSDCNVGTALTSSSLDNHSSAAPEMMVLHGEGGDAGVSREAAAEVERAAFVAGIAALAGVVLTSAFGFVYLEWQLKLHAQDPLFVQLHQMNSFGAAVSLIIHCSHHWSNESPRLFGAQKAVAATAIAASSSAAAAAREIVGGLEGPAQWMETNISLGFLSLTGNATSLEFANRVAPSASPKQSLPAAMMTAVVPSGAYAMMEGPPVGQIVVLLACIVARGVLSGKVLKQLDSLAKGLIDVTAIVLCTCLQIALDRKAANGTVLGIQFLMLLSIVTYIMARDSSLPRGGHALPHRVWPEKPATTAVLELPAAPSATSVRRQAPKVL